MVSYRGRTSHAWPLAARAAPPNPNPTPYPTPCQAQRLQEKKDKNKDKRKRKRAAQKKKKKKEEEAQKEKEGDWGDETPVIKQARWAGPEVRLPLCPRMAYDCHAWLYWCHKSISQPHVGLSLASTTRGLPSGTELPSPMRGL